ncbi:C4b-binding protein alpha chain [Chionomys nivalis]|uniref:C4b-binding protein alpha chain n=1 Tax=Chionomys nivalis TaxID=269649 RepID=UPI002593D03F|nr:C4b-binding protein alpha chain [Chionomys nivalis]XP_057626000.1 C4b-binding protein alpha chain [Chionomys nivalis]
MWAKQPQATCPTRAPQGRLQRNRDAVAWPFSRLWRASDPTLFQMTIIAALWVTVFGKCGPPPDIPGALLVTETNKTEFESFEFLKYSCRPGYIRATSGQAIYCEAKGTWTVTISCVKKSCRNPGDLPNGQVDIKSDFSLGSRIEFSCLEGYILIGSSTSYCEIQSKGVAWSDPLPECVSVKCRAPPDISHGRHSGGDEDFYTYGSSITYRCYPNFSLIGSASITCTVVNKTVGVWSPSPPTCERINCPQPYVLYGVIDSGFKATYKYKDSVRFACLKGTILSGKNTISCEADGNWHPSPPVCEPNGCTNIPDIPHASWLQNFLPKKEDIYPVGATLQYRCHPGYAPATRERTTLVCQKDFTWSPFKGCKEVCCPVPDSKNVKIIQHMKLSPENGCTYFYNDKVSYKCQDDNISSATCKSDGTWNPRTPSCDQNCNVPPNIAHGHYTKSTEYLPPFRPKATYECDKGYRLVGEADIYCRYSQWTPAAPQCKAVCQKPEIKNGMLSANKDQYVESESATIQCYSGFALLGSQNITCLENGTWYPEMPKCEQEKDCEHVFAGKKLMRCLSNPNDVKMALEVYKLSREIELLELQITKAKQAVLEG